MYGSTSDNFQKQTVTTVTVIPSENILSLDYPLHTCIGYIKKMVSINGQQAVGGFVYRKVFNEEFNLGFHQPCKDQCAMCTDYRRKEQIKELSEEDKTDFEGHMKRKQRARNFQRARLQHLNLTN